ncbi:MAG: insulinase family protein [Melioribacteraceae bacterium]
MFNKKYISVVRLVASLLFVVSSIKGQNKSAVEQSLVNSASVPKGVSIHQLDNGIKVLLIENPALPMIGANMIIKVGSAYETFSTSGMSHMLEHLLFNGTTKRNQKQLYGDVDMIGGYNNASTTEYYTNFMMVTPSENIRKGMEIQADMLFNSTLLQEKFDKEKGIVLEEISKSLINPTEQLERNTLSVLYEGHALSLSTLGTYSTIQSMSRDAVNSFYKNYYVPNNMILSVIGNFNTKDMFAQVREIYGKANPGVVKYDNNPEWATRYEHPIINVDHERFYFRNYDGEDNVLQLFFDLPLNESNEYYQMIETVLEKSKEKIQAELKGEFPGLVKSLKFSTRLTPIKNYLETVLVLSNKIKVVELYNSVIKKLSNLSFVMQSEAVKQEATKARTEFVRNIEKPHMFGIYNSGTIVFDGIESLISSFSGEGFYSAAKKLQNLKLNSNPVVIVQYPITKSEKESAGAKNVKQFKDAATGKNLIVAQNEVSNLLAIHYLVKHKAYLETKYGKDAAKFLHDCIDQRFKNDENQKKSSQFGFSFTVNDNPMIPMDDIYLHPDFGYIRVEGLADDVEGAVKYLNGVFGEFVPTKEEFNKAVEKYKSLTAMMMGGDKVKKVFDAEYKAAVYEKNDYQNQPEITYESLLLFTKEYFQPSNMIISVVSPASPAVVENLFSSLRYEPIKDEKPAFTPTYLLKEKPETIDKKGGGERSYLFYGFVTEIDIKDAPALQALSLLLSDKIVFEIREKLGMAYGMSAGIDVVKNKALFFINQGTRPQNVDKLVSLYPGFFNMSVLDSLNEKSVEKSINMFIGKMMFRRLSSINQAFYLGSSEYFSGDFNYDANFLESVKKIKLEDVRAVAKKYMKNTNPTTLIVR